MNTASFKLRRRAVERVNELDKLATQLTRINPDAAGVLQVLLRSARGCLADAVRDAESREQRS